MRLEGKAIQGDNWMIVELQVKKGLYPSNLKLRS